MFLVKCNLILVFGFCWFVIFLRECKFVSVKIWCLFLCKFILGLLRFVLGILICILIEVLYFVFV